MGENIKQIQVTVTATQLEWRPKYKHKSVCHMKPNIAHYACWIYMYILVRSWVYTTRDMLVVYGDTLVGHGDTLVGLWGHISQVWEHTSVAMGTH